MKALIKNTNNKKWELQCARKYTTLLLNNIPFQQWANEDLATTLKTNDFNEQVKWFETNLK